MGWIPDRDLTFTEVESSKWGRVKMWLHYDLLHPWVLPWLPDGLRTRLYKASRRWLYGPNANYEDLIELIQRTTAAARRARRRGPSPVSGG
jgi:hypothetical protein